MNHNDIVDLLFGSTIVPEIRCEYSHVPLTKKEKRKIRITQIKEILIETLWLLLLTVGIIFQVGGLAYIAGVFFKAGIA